MSVENGFQVRVPQMPLIVRAEGAIAMDAMGLRGTQAEVTDQIQVAEDPAARAREDAKKTAERTGSLVDHIAFLVLCGNVRFGKAF